MVVAIIHFLIVLAVLGWGVVSIVRGDLRQGLLILVCLAFYYIVFLHPQVKKEIARRRGPRA